MPGFQSAMAAKESYSKKPNPEPRTLTRKPESGVEVKGGRNIGQGRDSGISVQRRGRSPGNGLKDKSDPAGSPTTKSRKRRKRVQVALGEQAG